MSDIYNELLGDAPKCPHGNTCVETGKCGDRPLCPVNQNAGLNFLLLENEESRDCPYRLSFNTGAACCCPKHYTLYKKTGR